MQQTLPPAPLQGAATWRIGGHDDRAISHLFWEIHRQPKPTHCQHNTVATNGTNYTKKDEQNQHNKNQINKYSNKYVIYQ